ncbi:PREDICTED: muellerian-inhibiting factor [Crocodylus porosus]|uniref:Muellerian-inhibiting factor n=1 Tax=Crocodylus porosus TaxID=8502 RepID=A0A7M4EQ90_CROPO|nr:PREDICTED: muellerian-inhibiting factor [Crocodylus porosus]
MGPVLRGVLQCLLLLFSSTALPRIGSFGEGLSPAELQSTVSRELGLGEEENMSSHAGAGNFLASKGRATVATHLLLKAGDPRGDSKVGKHNQLVTGDQGVFSYLQHNASLHPWLLGGLEGPVCRLKMDRKDGLGQSHLEVMGVLTSYESDFIKLVRRASWEEAPLETFGLCSAGDTSAALLSLKRISADLSEPGESQFLVLHLEEVTWGTETQLRFKLPFQEDMGWSLGQLQFAVLVFYAGRRERGGIKAREMLWAEGKGLDQKQTLCLSRDTRYLVLGALVTSVTHMHSQLGFEVSLVVKHPGDGGSPLPPAEVQQLLFGSDEKCFTRMTPVVLLLAKPRREEDGLHPSRFLSVAGVVETVPYPQPSSAPAGRAEEPPPDSAAGQASTSTLAPGGTDQFLGSLTRFVSRILGSSGEPLPASRVHHWLDVETAETLPHQQLNLSEEATLEQLVRSEEPLLLLFPHNSQALLEQHFRHWRLEGRVLQLLLDKLQAVIQDLREIPAFQANAGLFQHLLAFCYYPPGPGSSGSLVTPLPEERRGPRQLHTLLLLKALQTVRAHWVERRQVLWQNRSARHQASCRLRELTVDISHYKFVAVPDVYVANNCEGPCRLPLSTRADYYPHTVLLLDMQERGVPLQRGPCCVPVQYSDQTIITLSEEGPQVKMFHNMVAKACGCR